jgi:hypothetical protein
MFRRVGIISMLGLTTFLFCGFTAPIQCKESSSNSNGAIIGGIIGAGAVITAAIVIPIVIVHDKHTLHGCAFNGANGLQVQQEGSADENGNRAKNFTLTGLTSAIKPGDMVKLHGTKQPHKKHDPVDQGFVVDSVKDSGPCKVQPTAASITAAPAPSNP